MQQYRGTRMYLEVKVRWQEPRGNFDGGGPRHDKDRTDKLNFFVLVIAIGESAGPRSLHPAPTLRRCTTRSLMGDVFARSDIQLTPGPAWNIGIAVLIGTLSLSIDR